MWWFYQYSPLKETLCLDQEKMRIMVRSSLCLIIWCQNLAIYLTKLRLGSMSLMSKLKDVIQRNIKMDYNWETMKY